MAATAWPDGCPPAILFHDHGYVLARGDAASVVHNAERFLAATRRPATN